MTVAINYKLLTINYILELCHELHNNLIFF